MSKQDKVKKEGFFKKVIKSVKDFDKYEDFGLEGVGKSSLYLLQMALIVAIVITAITVYQFSNTVKQAVVYFNNNVKEMTYADGILSINSNERMEVDTQSNIAGTIIVNTSDLTEEQLEEYKKELESKENAIVFLKEKVLMKNSMLSSITETSYSKISEQYNINSLDKEQVLNFIYTNQAQLYVSVAIVIFIYMFAIYASSILVDSLVLAALGFIISRLVGLRIRFAANFSMGVHALTLSIILNIIYIIINSITGITVKYFQLMYTLISYIYVVASILIIRSEFIKKQANLQKIEAVQEQVRAKLEEEKRKEQDKEAENKEEEEKHKQKEKEEQSEDDNSDEKPQGNNA